MVQSLTLGFVHLAIVEQSEDFKNKKINMINFYSKSRSYLCVRVSLSLCVNEC